MMDVIDVGSVWTSDENPPEPPAVTTVRYRQIHHRVGFKFSTVVTTVKWIEIGMLFLALMLFPSRAEADLTPGAGAPVIDVTGQAESLDADEDTASVALQGQQGASVFIEAGTCALTLVPEVSVNNGTDWVSAVFLNAATGTVASSVVMTNPNSTASYVIGYFGAATHARVRVSDYTSGSCIATLRATQNRPYVVAYAADGTTLRPIKASATGVLDVNISGGVTGYAEDAAHTSGDTGSQMLCVRNDTISALAGTTGDYIPCTTDGEGRIYVGSGSTADYDTGAGTENLPLYGIGLPGDGGPVAGGTTTNPVQVAVPQSGNNLCTGRTVLTTSGQNEILCNNSSAVLYQVRAMNPLTTAYCLHVYNLTAAPTAGTDTPKQTFLIPAAQTTGLVGGFIDSMTVDGVEYDTGLGIAVVATVTSACIDASTTSAGAGIQIDIIYRDKP